MYLHIYIYKYRYTYIHIHCFVEKRTNSQITCFECTNMANKVDSETVNTVVSNLCSAPYRCIKRVEPPHNPTLPEK